MKNYVVINEQHQLMDSQIALLNEVYGENSWERWNVPATGLTALEMEEAVNGFIFEGVYPVFASPIPLMIALMCGGHFALLHNDKREKKELPNGKVIMTVAQTGWELKTF